MKAGTIPGGYSLIELIVTLALMGFMAAIALPAWNSMLSAYALNNSTRQVQSELHNLKIRAAAENVSYQLVYQQGARAYTIQRDTKTLATRPLAEATTITKEGTIMFSPRGTASGNRVRLSNANGECKQIVVSATGRIRICTPNVCSTDC